MLWIYFFWTPLFISLTSLEVKLEREVEMIWELQREAGRSSHLGGWWGRHPGASHGVGELIGAHSEDGCSVPRKPVGQRWGPLALVTGFFPEAGEKVARSCLLLCLCPVPGIPGFSSLFHPCVQKLFLRTFSLAWENPGCVISASPFCCLLCASVPSLSTLTPPGGWKWKDVEALLRDAVLCVGWQVRKTLFCSPPSLSSFISYVAHGFITAQS